MFVQYVRTILHPPPIYTLEIIGSDRLQCELILLIVVPHEQAVSGLSVVTLK